MNSNIQIIERDGQPEYAVVPFAEFERMRRLAEEAEDLRAYDAAMSDDGEVLPHEVVRRLVEGDAPLRVWREFRGMTQSELAQRAGVDKTYVSQIESGRKSGSVKVINQLAEVLGVTLDDLIPARRSEKDG